MTVWRPRVSIYNNNKKSWPFCNCFFFSIFHLKSVNSHIEHILILKVTNIYNVLNFQVAHHPQGHPENRSGPVNLRRVIWCFHVFSFHLCRAYMSVKELKEELQLSGTDTLNVFFASNSVREELAGAATWPWAKEALTHQGTDVKVISPHLLLLYPTIFESAICLNAFSQFLCLFVHTFLSSLSSVVFADDVRTRWWATGAGKDFPGTMPLSSSNP